MPRGQLSPDQLLQMADRLRQAVQVLREAGEDGTFALILKTGESVGVGSNMDPDGLLELLRTAILGTGAFAGGQPPEPPVH